MSESALITPWSVRLTLDETVQRLQANDRVTAVGFLGSTGIEEWTEASDFDLCLLLRDYRAGLGVEATFVDGRIADVVIIGVDQAVALGGPAGIAIDEALTGVPAEGTAPDPDAVTEREWPFVRWLAQSRPVYDPEGLGGRARDRAVQLTTGEVSVDRAWQQTTRSFLTHDLKVNASLARRVDDPVVRVALGMRQLHTFVAAVQAWFTARGFHSEGWKKDIALVAEADPAFFDVIERWLAASDVATRHEIFCDAVPPLVQNGGCAERLEQTSTLTSCAVRRSMRFSRGVADEPTEHRRKHAPNHVGTVGNRWRGSARHSRDPQGTRHATSLCGYDEPLLAPEPGMKPCANCQETLKALVDSMPPNATV